MADGKVILEGSNAGTWMYNDGITTEIEQGSVVLGKPATMKFYKNGKPVLTVTGTVVMQKGTDGKDYPTVQLTQE